MLHNIEKILAEANEVDSSDSSSELKRDISECSCPFLGSGSVIEATQVEATAVSRDLDSKNAKEEVEILRSKLAGRRKIRPRTLR